MAGEHTPRTPLGGVKAFNCRSCGGQVQLLAPGQTLSAACSHCGAVADLTDENFRIISRAESRMSRRPLLEIGSKGNFEGKSWQIVGYMVRRVAEFDFVWEEYLLFNPYHGFRFLSNAYGHWSWIKMVSDMPFEEYFKSSISYKGQGYKRLSAGYADVVYVLGEFYWKVAVGDRAETADYVSPPYMLSREVEAGGLIWSQGTYTEPVEVAKAFGLDRSQFPSKRAVGANQPNPYRASFRRIRLLWLLAMVVTLLVGLGTATMSPKELVVSQRYPFGKTEWAGQVPEATGFGDQKYRPLEDTVSEAFTLKHGINNVEITVKGDANLDNHWLEYSGVLNDTVTNANYAFTVPVEYYHGVSDGESWSEGSQENSLVLNEIPAGTYILLSSVASDTPGEVFISIHRSVPIYTNWLMVLGILCVIPIYLLIRGQAFEKKREE
ncbi:MAG: DUF4178 domain-containing protein [Bacteroidia bacterium]